jgi:hypothetical protein
MIVQDLEDRIHFPDDTDCLDCVGPFTALAAALGLQPGVTRNRRLAAPPSRPPGGGGSVGNSGVTGCNVPHY